MFDFDDDVSELAELLATRKRRIMSGDAKACGRLHTLAARVHGQRFKVNCFEGPPFPHMSPLEFAERNFRSDDDYVACLIHELARYEEPLTNASVMRSCITSGLVRGATSLLSEHVPFPPDAFWLAWDDEIPSPMLHHLAGALKAHQHGADPHMRDQDGNNILHAVCTALRHYRSPENDAVDIVGLVTSLIQAGVDTSARNNEGNLPLQCLIEAPPYFTLDPNHHHQRINLVHARRVRKICELLQA